MMVLLFSILTFFYCFGICWLYWHWRHIPQLTSERVHTGDVPFISVVIPVRNEAENIISLLKDIAGQMSWEGTKFPSTGFEVIVVDDNSEDATYWLVEKYRLKFDVRISLLKLELPEDFTGSHKKMAITQAVKIAKGSIIVTTDGDCRVGPYWLASISQFFQQLQPALVAGPVTFHQEKSFFEHIQTIEFASLIGSGAASLYAHQPNMCNGANLAFTKEAFYSVKGYQGSLHIPSGDDEFLMQKIFQMYPQQVFFLKSYEAVVYTSAKPTLKEFYQQRHRWAGKWRLHKNRRVAALAVFIFIYHMTILASLLMVIAGTYPWLIFLLQLFTKILVEFFFLKDVVLFMKKKLLISNFLALECIYSAYVVFFGICANFGGYTWKKRQYK